MADNRWTQASLTDVVETWIVGSTPSRADPSRFALEGGAPWAKAVVEEPRPMRLKEAAQKAENGIEETLTYCDFPSETGPASAPIMSLKG